MRCVSPRSTFSHSALVMMRGSRSYGKICSVPSSRPYTVNVMPWFRKLRSAACFAPLQLAFGQRGEVVQQRLVVVVQLVRGGKHFVVRVVQQIVLRRGALEGVHLTLRLRL